MALLLPHCPFIDFIEYIPSTRLNGRCHYYSKEVNTLFDLLQLTSSQNLKTTQSCLSLDNISSKNNFRSNTLRGILAKSPYIHGVVKQ